MPTQAPVQHSLESAVQGRYIDDATDSGYGGSVIEGSASDSDNLFDRSFSTRVHSREHMPSDTQQAIYKENCLLLTGSIQETKHLLNVFSISNDTNTIEP